MSARADHRRPSIGPRALLEVAAGGALGTLLRLAVVAPSAFLVASSALTTSTASRPATEAVALLAVNVVGATALGVLVGRRHRSAWVARWWPLLAAGLLGGLTTYSSMVVVAGRLGHALGLADPVSGRMSGAGLGLAAGYLAGSVLLGMAGYVVARRVTGGGPSEVRDGEADA